MRKAMIVFLAAIILVSVCFVSLHCVFLGVADDVTVTHQTLYGDPSVADGVNILVRNQYDQNLMWETSLTLGSDSMPETEFIFSNEQITIPYETLYSGVEFNTFRDVFIFSHARVPESSREKYATIVKALTNAINAVPEGESKTFTVDFTQYLEYYPLEGFISVPGYEIPYSEFEHWTKQSEEISRRINDYFRIPMDGEFTVEYTIDKTSSGASYGASVNSSYNINGSGVTTDEACYFTFNTVMDDGKIADTSQIPGGYGIYRLPYEASVGVDFDALEMVYALDPTERYDSMYLSDDGKRIRLHTWQGNALMLTVIDIATMTQLQKVKLLTDSEEWYYDVIDHDDFTLIVKDRRNSDSMELITVWEELPDGTWSCAFMVETNRHVFPHISKNDLFGRYNNAVDYQNGKLVVITHQNIAHDVYLYDDYCDLYVAVYDASGMTYAGTCEWNLTQVNSLYPNTARVKPTFSGALEVYW